MIDELMALTARALGQPVATDVSSGWQRFDAEGLTVQGLMPDDVEIRFGKELVYGNVYGGYSYGSKESIERALRILRVHFVLEALSWI